MSGRVWILLAGALLTIPLWQLSIAQVDPDALLTVHRGAVVQLQVKGKINNQITFDYGTGFLVQTSGGPRIVTAGHVVGPDNRWDSLIDRCIYYRLAQFGSSAAYDCVLEAKVEKTIDLAEVYLDPFNATTLDIASAVPPVGSDLAVASWRSWGQPGSRAIAQAARLLDVQPDRLTLSGSYERSDSGSPVLDSQGRVVGLMIEAVTQPGSATQGIALPVTSFAAALSNAVAFPVKKLGIPRLTEFAVARSAPNGGGFTFRAERAGCVFLGKRSASVTRRPPDMPFGAGLLDTLRSIDGRAGLKGRELRVEVPVNIRSDCPTVVNGSAYYAPTITQLNPGDTFFPSEIQALNYLDDVFYWGRGQGVAVLR
jgi:hypothetical protein